MRLVPTDEHFYTLLEGPASHVTAAAGLLEDLFAAPDRASALMGEVRMVEHEADAIALEIVHRIDRSFITINLKKVRRPYLEEQLQLKRRRRRRRSATGRLPRAEVCAPNERWAMDVMHDVLATGQSVRVFTLVDVYSRECVALEVATSCNGAMSRGCSATRVNGRVGCRRSFGATMERSARRRRLTTGLLESRAARLQSARQTGSVCEAFNGSLRRECLTRHWFASLLEAKTELSTWRADYNNLRPHTRLGAAIPSSISSKRGLPAWVLTLRNRRSDPDLLRGSRPGDHQKHPRRRWRTCRRTAR